MEEILQQYGVIGYGIAILFGGVAGVKYLPSGIATKYRFLIFSLLVAIIFVLLEVFVQKNFKPEDTTKYLQTYSTTQGQIAFLHTIELPEQMRRERRAS